MSWETHWLIERPVRGRALPAYWVQDGSAWTDDPWQATRYATKDDAELELGLLATRGAKAVSHGFEITENGSDGT